MGMGTTGKGTQHAQGVSLYHSHRRKPFDIWVVRLVFVPLVWETRSLWVMMATDRVALSPWCEPSTGLVRRVLTENILSERT